MSKSAVHSYLRYILTAEGGDASISMAAGIAVLFLLQIHDVREISSYVREILSAFLFLTF